jgi:secondary thiamine-phosphate synthase enzyme
MPCSCAFVGEYGPLSKGWGICGRRVALRVVVLYDADMQVNTKRFSLGTRGKGTYEVTSQVQSLVSASGIVEGTATVFVQHTSCSLVLFENADSTARMDLEAYFDRLVPEDLPYFVHTYEGPDDMPSHIRMVLTRSSEVIPISQGNLLLGTWQGLFLFEHRAAPHQRKIVVTVMGMTSG